VKRLDAFDGTPILDIKPYDNWDLAPDLAASNGLQESANNSMSFTRTASPRRQSPEEMLKSSRRFFHKWFNPANE